MSDNNINLKLSIETEKALGELKLVATNLDELAKKLQANNNADVSILVDQFGKVISATDKFKTGLQDVDAELGKLKNNNSGGLGGLGDGADKLQDKLYRVKVGFESIQSAANGVMQGMHMIGQAIQSYENREKQLKGIDSVLQSMGKSSEISSDEILKMSKSLRDATGFQFKTGEILDIQPLILGFENIKKEQIPQVTETIINLASRMKTDLKSATMAVGLALEDPANGLGRLARGAGIKISVDTKEAIKGLVETGRTAEAQSMLFEELERRVGGYAKSQQTDFETAEAKLDTSMGSIKMNMGSLVAQGVSPLASGMSKMLDSFDKAPSVIKNAVGVIGLLGGGLGAANVTGIMPMIVNTEKLKGVMSTAKAGMAIMAEEGVTVAGGFNVAGTAAKGFFASLGPLGWAILTITALSYAFEAFSSSQEEATQKMGEGEKQALAQKESFAQLAKTVEDGNKPLEARKEALKKMQEIQPGYLDGLNLEKIKQQDLAIAIRAATVELEKQTKLKAIKEKKEKLVSEKVENNNNNSPGFWDYVISGFSEGKVSAQEINTSNKLQKNADIQAELNKLDSEEAAIYGDNKQTNKAIVKNKAYYDTQLKNQQDELAGLANSKENYAKIKELKKSIAATKKELEVYNTDNKQQEHKRSTSEKNSNVKEKELAEIAKNEALDNTKKEIANKKYSIDELAKLVEDGKKKESEILNKYDKTKNDEQRQKVTYELDIEKGKIKLYEDAYNKQVEDAKKFEETKKQLIDELTADSKVNNKDELEDYKNSIKSKKDLWDEEVILLKQRNDLIEELRLTKSPEEQKVIKSKIDSIDAKRIVVNEQKQKRITDLDSFDNGTDGTAKKITEQNFKKEIKASGLEIFSNSDLNSKQDELLNKRKSVETELGTLITESRRKELELEKSTLDAKLAMIDQEKQARLDLLKSIEDGAGRTGNVLGSIANIQSQQAEKDARVEKKKETEKLKKDRNEALSHAKTQKDKDRINELYDQKQQEAEDAIEAKTRDKNKTMLTLEKDANIAKSAMATATAVTEALPNIPLSIAVGAIGAAETAVVAATPLPGYVNGGLVPGNVKAIQINEQGQEFVMNAKATSANLPILDAMNKGAKLPYLMSNTVVASRESNSGMGEKLDSLNSNIEKYLKNPVAPNLIVDDRNSQRIANNGKGRNIKRDN